MLPDEFKKIRKAMRMTQAQLAERLDVSRKTVVNWEAGTFSIPEDALDTLTEKGMALAPAPIEPLTPKNHPECFTWHPRPVNTFQRNHKHPHWWTRSLWHYMSKVQQELADQIATTTTDLETMVWTPERAVVFTMTFVHKTREEAEDICRSAGFDLPPSAKQLAVAAHRAKWAALQLREPGVGWARFYELHPEEREHADESEQPLSPPIPGLQQAMDDAFYKIPPTKFDQPKGN